MLTAEITFAVNGKELSVDSFVQAIVEGLRTLVLDELNHSSGKRENPNREHAHPTSESPRHAVSVREAARLLSLSRRTLDNYIALKRIRVVRVGRRVLVPMTSVNEVARRGIPGGSQQTFQNERQ